MVVAPSRSFKILSEDTVKIAIERLNELGLEVVFGKHISECDEFLSSSIESRLEDLHDAFRDDSIAGIFSVIGGSSTNQIVDYIDYDLIKANPKIIC
jgi:muramoyltetrapeptide carboxypeptidase LdcA involved in peptidoglycan recycling